MDVGQEDLAQVFTLASIWVLLLAIGSSACAVPIIYTIGLAYQDASNSGLSYVEQRPALEFLATINGILFMVFGSLVGVPIASASGESLQSVVGCESCLSILQSFFFHPVVKYISYDSASCIKY